MAQINVESSPLPFSNLRQSSKALPGSTLFDIVDNNVPDRYKNAGLGAIVTINGEIVPVEYWDRIKPKPNTLVNIRVVPQGGGGGKNPLAAILSIAVLIAAPYLAPIIGTALGVTSTIGVQLIGAAIGAVGRLAISALAPPPKQSNVGNNNVSNPTSSPTQFIEGANNALNPYGVVPINLGVNRIFPFQGARPYTESQNNDQYVRQIFTYGFSNETIIGELKLADTALDEFKDFDIEHKLQGDLHEGSDLYSNDVFQEDLSIVLNQVDGYSTITSAQNADELQVDITFPRGLAKFNDEGKRNSRRVTLEAQYAKTGESPQVWSPAFAEYTTFSGKTFGIAGVVGNGYNRNARGGSRTDVVVVNKYSGKISVIAGQVGWQSAQPIPSSSIRIANITVSTVENQHPWGAGNGTFTTTFSLSDVRQSSLFGSTLEDNNSFVPTKISPTQYTISDGAILVNDLDISANTSEALRKSLRVVLPERGQYDVRVRRITADTTNDQILDQSAWTALKSVRYESPIKLQGLCGTALRIKATDQLNGSVDQYNLLAKNIIPDYDPELDEWPNRITSNPASLYRYVLQCDANEKPLPDEKIDLDALADWHLHCVDQGYSYNRNIDYETSVDEILRDIASAGAASPAIVDGKRTIVIDRIKDDVVQIVTPRNSWNYSGQMLYPEIPHAFRVQFRNKDEGYAQDELIVYDDGYDETNATLFELLELQSCTNATLAFKTARRHLASIRLRPETHTFMMDFEHLVALRGDRIKLEHDAPIIGIGDGRIKEVFTSGGSPNLVTGFSIDDTVRIPSNGMYYVRVRLSDGTFLYKQINVFVGADMTQFNFTSPFDIEDTPSAGDLCYFVEAGHEVDLVITRIEPQDEYTARITAVNYAPEIFSAETAPIPKFNSNITTPLEFIRPLPPLLLEEQSNEDVMLLNSDGSFTSRAVFTLENQNNGVVETKVKVRASGTDFFTNANVLEATPERLIITGLEDGTRYDIHIRYRRIGTNTYSKPLELNTYLFVGASGLPDDVSGFLVNVVDNVSFFKWDANDDIDLSHYKIKYSNVYSGASWATAQTLENKIFETKFTTPFLGGTYLIKAVDLSNNESENPTAIITYNPGVVANAVAVLEESPEFLGLKQDVISENNSIVLSNPEINVGYYYFNKTLDLTDIFPSFVSAKVIANGAFINNVFAESDIFGVTDIFGQGQNNVFDIEDVFNNEDVFGIGVDGWAVALEYRKIDSSPSFIDINNNLADTDASSYSDTRGIITVDDNLNPMGDLEAYTFTEDTADGQHYIRPETNLPLDVEHTYSIFVKSTNRWVRLLVRDDTDTSHYFWINVDLQNGVIVNNFESGNATFTDFQLIEFGNGWYRITATGIVNSAGGTRVQTYVYSLLPDEGNGEISYIGDDSSTLNIWGLEIVASSNAYNPLWESWNTLEAGTITFQGIQFRVKMESLQENVSPQITTLSVNIDMPDRIERGEDVDVPIDGITIDFTPKFKATPAIAITIQDGTANDSIEYIEKNSGGFTFKVYNTDTSGYVARTVDYIASGFGRKNT